MVGGLSYEDRPGELFAIRGKIPADGLPAIVWLEAIHFAVISFFVGTLRLEFGSHLSRLASSPLHDFEDSLHQPKVEDEYDGARLIKSRGLAFVPCVTIEIMLEQGPRSPITEVVSHVFVGPGLQKRAFDPAIDWMQASFTFQADSAYTRHIHMRREPQRVEFAAGYYWGNMLLTQLRSAFPSHCLPESCVRSDQKEDRAERSAWPEASMAMGTQYCMRVQKRRRDLARRKCRDRYPPGEANNHCISHQGGRR